MKIAFQNMNNFALNCIIATSLLVNTFPPSSTVTPKPSFTQLSCKVLDKNYLAVEECSMNSENVVNIRVKLHKRPMDNITVSIATQQETLRQTQHLKINLTFTLFQLQGMVMKYVDDSYQIYYFNNVYDICKIMRSKRNFFVEYVYQQALPYTNFNHTCPFTEVCCGLDALRLDHIAYIITITFFNHFSLTYM